MNTTTVVGRLAAVVFSIALAGAMTACSPSAEPTGGLAVVVGGHSNMPVPSLDGEAAAALDEALSAQSYFAMVVADGEPFVMEGAGILTARDDNSQIQERDRERNREAIDSLLAEARAKSPETDLLAGLALAARSVASTSGDHTIVVVDSGLSTAGALNFAAQPELLDADPEELAQGLADAGQLPDLSDIRVIFQGLGDTAPPQPALDQRERANLVAIWEAIVRAATARNFDVEPTPLSGSRSGKLPHVSPVPVKRGSQCLVEAIALGESDVAFKADSSQFVDGGHVRSVLGPIAKRMLEQDLSAALTGTTADVGATEGQEALSVARAEAVARMLMDSGVPADHMAVAGLGSNFPGYDASDLAANRKVTLELSAAAPGVSCQAV